MEYIMKSLMLIAALALSSSAFAEDTFTVVKETLILGLAEELGIDRKYIQLEQGARRHRHRDEARLQGSL